MAKKLVIPLVAVAMLAGATAGFAGMAAAQTSTTAASATTSGGPPMAGLRSQGPHIDGTVTAVSGTTITLTEESNEGGTVYTVNAGGATVNKNGTASALANVTVGDKIFVLGTVNGTTVTATQIDDGMPAGGMRGMMHGSMGMGGPRFEGAVSAINGNTITLTETVDASKATVMKNGSAGTLSNVAVGDMISVEGTASGASVTANRIMDGKPSGSTQ